MASRKPPSVRLKSSSDSACREDEVLREVYAERDRYAAEHGYDLDRIYNDLKQREARSRLKRTRPDPVGLPHR